jgi:hypothetical protein
MNCWYIYSEHLYVTHLHVLVYVHQEKIALEIAEKIASVNSQTLVIINNYSQKIKQILGISSNQ